MTRLLTLHSAFNSCAVTEVLNKTDAIALLDKSDPCDTEVPLLPQQESKMAAHSSIPLLLAFATIFSLQLCPVLSNSDQPKIEEPFTVPTQAPTEEKLEKLGEVPPIVSDDDPIEEEHDDKQWQATEETVAKPEPAEETVPPRQFKDEFKEELVIRPLQSGDIYASFQFRTLWDTDFLQGKRGRLVIHLLTSYPLPSVYSSELFCFVSTSLVLLC